MGTKFVNLMNSPVRVLRNSDVNDGSYISFRSYANEYGVNLEDAGLEAYDLGVNDNVFIVETRYGDTRLPEPESGTIFIVPMEIAISSDRPDLVYPIEGMAVSEGSNSIVYKGLARFNR